MRWVSKATPPDGLTRGRFEQGKPHTEDIALVKTVRRDNYTDEKGGLVSCVKDGGPPAPQTIPPWDAGRLETR